MTEPENRPLAVRMADAIRVLSAEAVHHARSGHQGMPMGFADVATVLWTKFLKFDPTDPTWPDRDRFVLSAGHGSMLIYSLLHLYGVKAVSMDQIRNFRQWGSNTAGHPEFGHTPGVECTTGPLGQGLATAVGMAMAERHLNARLGDDAINHKTWAVAGDGCLMEGVSHEAISLAGRLKLKNLIVLFDDNNVTIEGEATIAETGDQLARFRAAGWAVRAVDGHDHAAIARALSWATRQEKPVLVACKTKIARGAGPMEGDIHGHGYNLFDKEIAAAREAMGWSAEPFTVPDDILKAWRAADRKGKRAHAAWKKTVAAAGKTEAVTAAFDTNLSAEAVAALDAYAAQMAAEKPADATRSASGKALEVLVPLTPALIGGSADLTGSNNTLVKGMGDFDAPDYAGRYVRYGVREFGMAAAMNGMALHGGVIPYGGTFFVFSDYSRPAIRLAALMGIQVVHVLTHDSIGVGEDGPTHQPVEHLASFRAMPGVLVMRPADRVEAAECWKAALQHRSGPTLMVLSRQKAPAVRSSAGDLAAKGAYELEAASAPAVVTLFATGTEVAVAVAARAALEAKGVPTRVVSVPCWELFAAQSEAYRRAVLGDAQVKVAIEAGARLGWERFIGADGIFVGMSGFGASAPAEVLYEKFAITPERVAAEALARLN